MKAVLPGPRSNNHRRDKGVFFTPNELVFFVVGLALRPHLRAARRPSDLLRLRICDPAAGAGAFLLEALDLIAERLVQVSHGPLSLPEAKCQVAEHCLYGVDADLVSVALCRALIAVRIGGGPINAQKLATRLRWGDSLLWDSKGALSLNFRESELKEKLAPPFPWPAEFPEVFGGEAAKAGFDIVIGNPPWGAVKPAFKEYHAQYDGSVRNGQGDVLRRQVSATASKKVWRGWVEYQERIRSYALALRAVSSYQHQGAGDTELYRYFLERAHQLVGPRGRIAMVVPAAIERAQGAAPLRQLLLGSGTLEQVLDFENRRRLFPIHSMFRFAVVVWQKGECRGIDNVAFGLHTVDAARTASVSASRVALPLTFLRASGDRLSIPEMRSVRDRELFARLQKAAPALGDRLVGGWSVRFVRELDMTNDSHLFVRAHTQRTRGRHEPDGSVVDEQGRMLFPLYEGRLVHQFDAAAKRYIGGDGRMARWEPLPFGHKALLPHFFVDPEHPKVQTRWPRRTRAGFCDVTGHANERTVLAALIPANAVCGNKVPTCRFEPEQPALHFLWLALANSFVVDWYMRRQIGTSLNFFLWEQVPFPRIDPAGPAAQELIGLAEQLCRMPWEERSPTVADRARLRATADAAVIDLYGLDLDEYVWLLRDFPLLDRGQPSCRGVRAARRRSSSTITRDTAILTLSRRRGMDDVDVRDLSGFDADEGPTSLAERISLAKEAGAIAYVPSEPAARTTTPKSAGVR